MQGMEVDDDDNTIASAIVAGYRDGIQVIRLFTNPERRNEGHGTEVMLKILFWFAFLKG